MRPTGPALASRLLFSALDSSVAGRVETAYAEQGHVGRLECAEPPHGRRRPLLVPEVNADHLALLDEQPYEGALITNPNCSTIGLTLALGPLHRAFGSSGCTW